MQTLKYQKRFQKPMKNTNLNDILDLIHKIQISTISVKVSIGACAGAESGAAVTSTLSRNRTSSICEKCAKTQSKKVITSS